MSRAQRTGSSAGIATGLLAIGPDIICTGHITQVEAASWTLLLDHFVAGDMHQLVAFIDSFGKINPEARYVLSNDLGDGRQLIAARSLTMRSGAYTLLCPIARSFPRTDAQKLGSDLALDPETNDLFLDSAGHIARVAGIDALPQRVLAVLSMQRGESVFSPEFGMRFYEYFEAFRGSPWLDLLLKLDVVRQASIPFRDSVTRREYTPLQCVTRVRNLKLLSDEPTDNRLPLRVEFEVQGIGSWSSELSVYLPTPEEMAEREKMVAERPWLYDTL